jgi:hypothetical protein
MKSFKFILTYLLISSLLWGCGTTKGYIGNTRPDIELGIIRGESNHVTISGKRYKEKAYIANVDSLVVGSYYKGWPKNVKVLPGERFIEVRHYMPWIYRLDYYGGGIIGGAIVGSANEESMTHYHYIFKFLVEKNMNYSIRLKTLSENTDNPAIEVFNNTLGEAVDFEVTEKIFNKK